MYYELNDYFALGTVNDKRLDAAFHFNHTTILKFCYVRQFHKQGTPGSDNVVTFLKWQKLEFELVQYDSRDCAFSYFAHKKNTLKLTSLTMDPTMG